VIGQRISHFYVIRLLGSGGMGVVYEAQDTRLPRSVAIKVLKPALSRDADALRRFKREARLASSLNHPNICTVLDVDEGDGSGRGRGGAFIAMELLQGRSLKARLTAEPLPLAELLDVASQVADALAAAHEQGIVHRDIAPGNVFLSDGGLVKLLDFGVAKHLAPAPGGEEWTTDDLTATGGAAAGTIHYMAPERLAPDAPVDHRCDLYSLGAVLYQMATGARPFDVPARDALVAAIRSQPHVPVRQMAPRRPAALERIVDRLLAKRPEERYQSARALRADLDALRDDLRAPATPVGTTSAGGVSVAVLPFEIVGACDATTRHFRDGLAEDIAGLLGALDDVRVAPRTSTRLLLGRSVRELGRELAVDLVLEGTVQHSADRVRVTANLVDAARERSVRPALRVERRFADLLATQDDVARAVCDGLAPSLAGAAPRRARDPEAYHALKRGQHHWRSCLTGGWRPAIEHFQYAVERDDRFAPAHVALADAYNFLGQYCLMKPNLAFGVAARAAERALAIDGTLASAQVQLAIARFGGDWDWEASEAAFRRAIALDARDPLAHVYYSWLLILLGREDAALAEAERGHALAPTSRLVTTARAQTLYIGGRHDEAIALCDACLRADPGYVFAVQLRGLCHLARSAAEHAIPDLERAATLSGRTPYYLGLLGRCYGQAGLRGQALALVSELERQARDGYVPPQSFVFIYAGLGERERALAYQEQAYEDGASPFNYLTPSIRDLYALDPYHKRRLEQMRLVL
jgi:serine/threonine-protein kinase